METLLLEQIVEKLKILPESNLHEVIRYIDYLNERGANVEKPSVSEDPLLSVAGILSGSPLNSEVVDQELYGA